MRNNEPKRSLSLQKSLALHAREYYPSSTHGVYATHADSAIAILLVANKYSPNNFWYCPPPPHLPGRAFAHAHPCLWSAAHFHDTPLTAHRNGRWRSTYILDPTARALSGTINVDVHYYEDGNVRLITNKAVSLSLASSPSSSGSEIMRAIAGAERKYQEELNRAFQNLSEGAFKGLRRQLPVTRQRVEWEKIAGYRVSFGSFFTCCFPGGY